MDYDRTKFIGRFSELDKAIIASKEARNLYHGVYAHG